MDTQKLIKFNEISDEDGTVECYMCGHVFKKGEILIPENKNMNFEECPYCHSRNMIYDEENKKEKENNSKGENMKKHKWNNDRHFQLTDDNGEILDDLVIQGVEGEPDKRISIQDIRTCVKYFGNDINDIFDDIEYSMAAYLAVKAEGRQKNKDMNVSLLDTIPLMSKWLTPNAHNYLLEKRAKQLGMTGIKEFCKKCTKK